jgi:SAM-dependent methyltransferase
MAGHLRRYGHVSAIDFSEPAVRLGRELLPDVHFSIGTTDELPKGETYDVITLFDVLEHIPPGDRSALFAELDARLTPQGQLILSTPHPRYTAWLRKEAPELMQAIEESVELRDVLELADRHDLELAAYETYDIWRTGPQYHFIALARPVVAGRPIAFPNTRFTATLRRRVSRPTIAVRRLRLVLACVATARWHTAAWFLSGGRRRYDNH